jgi:hypothetical protein
MSGFQQQQLFGKILEWVNGLSMTIEKGAANLWISSVWVASGQQTQLL